MPSIARVTVPGVPHYISQRGNRRQKTFFIMKDIWGKPSPLNEIVYDWKEYLSLILSEDDIRKLKRHERTGRPLGNKSFITCLEKSLGKPTKPKKPGRKPKKNNK